MGLKQQMKQTLGMTMTPQLQQAIKILQMSVLELQAEITDALVDKHAFCSSWLGCLGHELLLFETHRLDAPPAGSGGRSVVLRPRAFAGNPFWPYLDNLELAFLVGVMGGSLAAAWRARVRRPPP